MYRRNSSAPDSHLRRERRPILCYITDRHGLQNAPENVLIESLLEKIEFGSLGSVETKLRIGLHAGPVYRYFDPIIGKENFIGSHVNRAARIEPVTVAGCAFTSEQFAAVLAVEPHHEFVCEYVGIGCPVLSMRGVPSRFSSVSPIVNSCISSRA